MDSNQEITRDQFIELLESLVGTRRTCTLYVRTPDNHVIVVGLDSGKIVFLTCGARRGEQALQMIRSMQRGTYRLTDDAPAPGGSAHRLPSSEELLSVLKSRGAGPEGFDGAWAKDVLCQLTGSYLGPIAPIVCEDVISEVGGIDSLDKARQVVDKIAREIADQHEAAEFRDQAHKQLSSGGG